VFSDHLIDALPVAKTRYRQIFFYEVNNMATIAENLEKLWEHNRAMFPTPCTTPKRKVVVTQVGTQFKARFKGAKDCAFGATAEIATSRLKMFSGSRSLKEHPLKEEDFKNV
jgi:hypothetical protein